MINYRLELSYDGTRYHGWQRLKNNENTIQGKVEEVLSRILGEHTEVTASGRTDAGVHARCQVCSFKTESNISADEILQELRKYLPKDIGALALEKADERFHARYNCKEKTYMYRIRTSDVPNVFERNFFYRYNQKLYINEIKSAAAIIEGTHEFTAFTTDKHLKKSAVRTIKEIRIESTDEEIRIFVTADGFLWNMVRIIVGTLLDVGSGKIKSEDVADILDSGIRENAGFTAPACGLTLYEVKY